MRRIGLILIVFSGITTSVRGDVKLPAIFGDHMVLQHGQKDKVWGTADPGEAITVSIGDQSLQTRADSNGRWSVMLAPLPVGGPHTMTVAGRNTIRFEDVLVGEVWICSGQSNMEWAVNNSNDAELERRAAKFPKIRLISVPKVGTQEPQSDFKGSWSLCSPETVGDFSAVGYFFGRQLHQTLDVPIGLIDNAWGGSACEAWVRRDLLEKDERYKPLLERWTKMESDLKALAASKNQTDAQKKQAANLSNQMNGNHRPSNIYNGVLKPTIGYGIRGAIWYQGESNASRAYQYRHLFPLMIQSWRDEWGQGDFPFYWVQLADFKAEKAEPGDSDWAELREAQTMTMGKLPKTGEAVIIDIGEGRDIHPRNKQGVATRLARWALAQDYGIGVNHRSPTFKSIEVRDNKALVAFDSVGSGLYAFDSVELRGFAVAGDDRQFHWAQAKIVDRDKVEVWCDKVSHPKSVRYAWADNPVCNLYSRDGLPVTPFRTDDWDGVTANNH